MTHNSYYCIHHSNNQMQCRAAISTPTFSTPRDMCWFFHSHIFHPCLFVLLRTESIHSLHFHSPLKSISISVDVALRSVAYQLNSNGSWVNVLWPIQNCDPFDLFESHDTLNHCLLWFAVKDNSIKDIRVRKETKNRKSIETCTSALRDRMTRHSTLTYTDLEISLRYHYVYKV